MCEEAHRTHACVHVYVYVLMNMGRWQFPQKPGEPKQKDPNSRAQHKGRFTQAVSQPTSRR